MNLEPLLNELGVPFQRRAPLGPRTWYGVGGSAAALARPEDPTQLARLVGRCRREGVPVRVLGKGANLLVPDREITAVLDWGLSIAGHSEHDFFKAEKNFLRAHFELETRRDRYRPRLYRGYRDEYGLDPGWRARREFYDLAFTLESMYSFPRWTREMSRREQADMETTLRAELGAKLEGVSL